MTDFTREDIRQDTEETIRRLMPEIVHAVVLEAVPSIVDEAVGRLRVELLGEMQHMIDASVDDITGVIHDVLQLIGEELGGHDSRILRLERKVF